MGTRSLTHIHESDKDSPVLVTLYCQLDGYPSGVGKQLVDFLSSFTIKNGFSTGDRPGSVANGMGCLAAQLIGYFKGGYLGLWYVYPPNSTDCDEEYVYHVFLNDDGKVCVTYHDLYSNSDLDIYLLGEGSGDEIHQKDIVEFNYKKNYDRSWRTVKVTEETQDYICGNELSDGGKFKKFLKNKIVGKILRN